MKLNAIRCTPQLLRPTYKLVFKIDNFLIRGIDFIFPIGLGQILGLSPFSLGALTRLQSGPLRNVGGNLPVISEVLEEAPKLRERLL